MALCLDPVPRVWGITGNLGGGKTLSAVCLAVNALSQGYYVVSNVTLKMDVIAAELGDGVRSLYQKFSFDSETFDPFQLPCGAPRGSGIDKRVVVILDECAEWIDQYTTVQAPKIKRFLSWLRHSSKRSQDVVLIVQRLDYLNKNIRILISKWVICDDLLVWRVPVAKFRLYGLGGFVMQRVFSARKQLEYGPCLCNKKTFGAYYNTAECLNSDGAQYTTEYRSSSSGDLSIFRLFIVYLLSLLALVCLIVSLSSRVSQGPPVQSRPRLGRSAQPALVELPRRAEVPVVCDSQ